MWNNWELNKNIASINTFKTPECIGARYKLQTQLSIKYENNTICRQMPLILKEFFFQFELNAMKIKNQKMQYSQRFNKST